jgi:mannose/fructose-specific phosphotransferase system component IIA
VLRLFIASHGSIASGIKSALNILLGKSENVTVFDAYLDERNLKDELDKYFQSISEDDQVIMLSDLYGGSVNQIMYLYLKRPNTFLIAGINLPLVVELSLLSGSVDSVQLKDIVLRYKDALQFVEFSQPETKENDFFEAPNDKTTQTR